MSRPTVSLCMLFQMLSFCALAVGAKAPPEPSPWVEISLEQERLPERFQGVQCEDLYTILNKRKPAEKEQFETSQEHVQRVEAFANSELRPGLKVGAMIAVGVKLEEHRFKYNSDDERVYISINAWPLGSGTEGRNVSMRLRHRS